MVSKQSTHFTVLVVDDHELVRSGIISLLSGIDNIEIIGEAANGEEAIQIANATEYGLAGSIWSTDTERAHVLAQKIETGIVWVNTWLHRDLRTPFGGVKNSGVGREGGAWSLGFFSEPLNVCIKHD